VHRDDAQVVSHHPTQLPLVLGDRYHWYFRVHRKGRRIRLLFREAFVAIDGQKQQGSHFD
jgi:hypothetical protein